MDIVIVLAIVNKVVGAMPNLFHVNLLYGEASSSVNFDHVCEVIFMFQKTQAGASEGN